MFNSQAKYLNVSFNLIKKILSILISIIISILWILSAFKIVYLIPSYLYLDINNSYIIFLTNTLFFGTIGVIYGFLVTIIGFFIKKKCITSYYVECSLIINETSLPKKLPKVLYVYTSHNDLIEARVLQNSQQTYKNFEVWVSDGSDKKEWREKIKKFCKKNNINLYQLGPEGSKNKADNLNQFLSQHKGHYDYLLIGDADEVFHKNFVEYALKFFYSNKLKNLSYVSPININYRSKGIYPNTTRIIDTNTFYWEIFTRSFSDKHLPPLSGQSCLISRESLVECYGTERFDSGNLEDWYLETVMIEKEKFGIMIPNAPCYFEPDANVSAHFNRIMRIFSWVIRWWKIRKKEIINNYSGKQPEWYKDYFIYLLTPILIFLSIAFLCFFIWLLVNFWNDAFGNNLIFWIFLGSSISSAIIAYILKKILIGKINFNITDTLIYPFVFIMWIFAWNIQVTINWFKSFILGKYLQFGGSGSSRFFKSKNKMIKWWISFIVLTIVIAIFNSLIFLLTQWWSINYLVIIFNVYFGIIWLGCLSYIGLWYINLIPYNSSFKREDWVECKELFKYPIVK